MSLLRADARHLPLADGCVQCVVTSPPYWGLRDYGVTEQIGLERTPDAYVAELVAVFREVRRVLKVDGVCWLNLGDSYASTGGERLYGSYDGQTGRGPGARRYRPQPEGSQRDNHEAHPLEAAGVPASSWPDSTSLKAKDLIGIPWRVAFALQADGWYLRSDIIWHKPNPMPESVTDRPTKAHEYVFLLTKAERYYYDAKAISERATYAGKVATLGEKSLSRGQATGMNVSASGNGSAASVTVAADRNARTVWTIATQPYSGAHFATMPEALVERCVLAGSKCGDLVLDPFGGSGTTARVALSLGRRAVATEINPAYLTLARERTHVTYGLPLEMPA